MDQKKEYQATSHLEYGYQNAQDDRQGLTTVQVQDSRFATYLAHDKPSPVSKSLLKLYPILFVAFMNSAANGFDGNTFGESFYLLCNERSNIRQVESQLSRTFKAGSGQMLQLAMDSWRQFIF